MELGHCDLAKLEKAIKAQLVARQCSVDAAGLSGGHLFLQYEEEVTLGAARRWVCRAVTPVVYEWFGPRLLQEAEKLKNCWRRKDRFGISKG